MTKPPSTINLDADSLTREEREPFTVHIDGVTYPMVDPFDLTQNEITAMTSDPNTFARLAVPEHLADDFEAALGDLPWWKIDALSKGYLAHYAILDRT